MTDDQRKNVSRFVVPQTTLLQRIRVLAGRSDNIRWSHHARERMHERSITIRVATTVLQLGSIKGEITPGDNPGEWRTKVVRRKKGMRDVGVVVIVVKDDHLFVKTVEWEDLK